MNYSSLIDCSRAFSVHPDRGFAGADLMPLVLSVVHRIMCFTLGLHG